MPVMRRYRLVRIESAHILTIVVLVLHGIGGKQVHATEELAGLLHHHAEKAYLPINPNRRRYRLGKVIIEYED